jgi:two-component system, OmpR family, response regulator
MTIRVLVLDDDPMQLAMLERALPPQVFTVCCVESVAGMIAEGRAFKPQIVLLDVNIPGTTPEQMVALARDIVVGAKVVLYSAWEDSKLRALARQTGADAFISKSESVIGIGSRLRDLHGG